MKLPLSDYTLLNQSKNYQELVDTNIFQEIEKSHDERK